MNKILKDALSQLSLSFDPNGATYFVKTLYDVFSQIIELYKSLKYATVELDAGKRGKEIQQKI